MRWMQNLVRSACVPATMMILALIAIAGTTAQAGTPILDPIPAPMPDGDILIDFEVVATGLNAPLGLREPDDGSGRMFVYDQTGFIFVIENGVLSGTPVLDVSGRLPAGPGDLGERGLLGMALHPNFAANPKIYTHTSEAVDGPADFTTPVAVSPDHQSVIAEWTLTGADPDSNTVDVSTRREIMRIDQPQSNHNGGNLNFGPDELLYIALGDGGGADDQGSGHTADGLGQDPTNVYGTFLRIDVDGNNSANGEYGIPPMPFGLPPGTLPEVYAYGFRNPYSFSFDMLTGELYIGDVGQGAIEEVDIVEPGENYGWRIKEGTFYFNANGTGDGFIQTTPAEPDPGDLVDPIAQYDHDEGRSIIGGFVYRGSDLPALQGHYVCGDFFGSMFYLNDDTEFRRLLQGEAGNSIDLPFIRGISEDAEGELYVMITTGSPSDTTGQILRIVPAGELAAAENWEHYGTDAPTAPE